MRRVFQPRLNALQAADQTAQEAATDTIVYVSPAEQHYHRSAAKAWAHILLSGATPVLVTGYNIATVSGPASGMINVAFTTPMASAFYAVSLDTIQTSGGNNAVAYVGSQTTSGNIVIYVKTPGAGTLTSLYVGVDVTVNALSS